MAKSLLRSRLNAFRRQAGLCHYCGVLMCQRRAKIAQFWRLKFAHLVMSHWPVDLGRRVRLTVSAVSVSDCSVR